tara:strand:+ start:10043 stop:10501 length:459 start_codon:yes stop_codon:yes gene_type:complete
MKNLSVRLATNSDSNKIFEWRNDEYSRQMSHTTELIEWQHHINWFSKSLISEDRIILISEKSPNKTISVVSFDIQKSEAIVSINLNPIWRGKGLAKLCLLKSIEYFSKNYLNTKKLVAEIKKENILSKKIFLSVGFEKNKEENGIEFYKKTL